VNEEAIACAGLQNQRKQINNNNNNNNLSRIWTVLYGRETWSLTLREERRLRVFENRVLRRILGPKRDEVTGEWRKLHYGCAELSENPRV
jgi:hypothetical protein